MSLNKLPQIMDSEFPDFQVPVAAGASGVWKSRISPSWDGGRKTWFSNGVADKKVNSFHDQIAHRVLPYKHFVI